MKRGFVVALLGAESTGKTTLAGQLHQALAARGLRALRVDEVLRAFCVERGRTPRREEQQAIAAEQTLRIDAAAGEAEVVVADTTALMIAVYSELVFADVNLYLEAEQAQQRVDLTLLTALDLPWQPDRLRDGAHVRAPVDAALRAALARAGVAYTPVAGSGAARLDAALRAFDAVHPPVRRRGGPGRR